MKWQRRVGAFAVAPPCASEMNRLVLLTSLAVPQSKLDISSTTRTDTSQNNMGPNTVEGRPSVAVSVTTAPAPPAAPPQLSKSPAAPVLEALPVHHLPTPRAYANPVQSVGQGFSLPGGGAASARHGPTPSSSTRLAPSENYTVWPAEPNIARAMGCSSARGATAMVKPADRSPEPLVELAHVLNMMAPRPLGGNSLGNGCGPLGASKIDAGSAQQPVGLNSLSKHKMPSVAAELLIDRALRMQWPNDRRRVHLCDAVISCRDAAAVLNEAVAQLNAVADALEDGKGKFGGCISVQENAAFKPIVGSGSVSKRRRTFGGPSPTRAASPTTATGPLAPRGSPPVRFSGLRV